MPPSAAPQQLGSRRAMRQSRAARTAGSEFLFEHAAHTASTHSSGKPQPASQVRCPPTSSTHSS